MSRDGIIMLGIFTQVYVLAFVVVVLV